MRLWSASVLQIWENEKGSVIVNTFVSDVARILEGGRGAIFFIVWKILAIQNNFWVLAKTPANLNL